ncbi:hypothetical protein HPB51_028001 [Rhipicephalus microplus]|uniref:Uncharacterized protein n=1 Tax=Rhipicephalus microplus TaxID=6941 RepID=A0A9J6CY63_RHIMP|nr:hypothetical protein HPB51_028001 [Rhipicephalus microplus]
MCARALERVCGHHALPELLSELTSVSTAEATAMVRSCLRSIEGMQEFMRLAGVVNEEFACSARGDGCTQLADLNEHCWSHIRRYIKLYDIIHDETTPP